MVLEVMHNPEQVLESYRNRQLYRKQYGNEWLEVVTIKEDNKIIIITQYFLEQ
jgi:hypothetical protein